MSKTRAARHTAWYEPDVAATPDPDVRPKTAFVLGGGGNLGAVQVGMLKALVGHGIAPDVLLGCSVGALHAAALASDAGPAGVALLERTWLELNAREVFPAGSLSLLSLVTRRGPSLHANDGLRRVIQRSVPFRRFEEASIPFEVVATSLRSGRERWFTEGDVVPPILASAALPAVFPPVEIGGELFVDGGVVDNVPVSRAVELGAGTIYVLHVGNFDRPRPRPQRPLDVLLQSFSIARGHRFLRETAAPPAGIRMITLPSVDPGPMRKTDFTHSEQLMERAYAAASHYLESLVVE